MGQVVQSRTMTSALLGFLRTPDPGTLGPLLSEDIRFHSPVADYRGRSDVAHLLTLIAGVLEDVEPTRELRAGSELATFLTTAVQGHHLEGVLDEHYDAHGRLVEVTLMLRPLAALRSAVRAMGIALAAAPLPSDAGADS